MLTLYSSFIVVCLFWLLAHQYNTISWQIARVCGHQSSLLPTHRRGSLSTAHSRSRFFRNTTVTQKPLHIRVETTALNHSHDLLAAHLSRKPVALRLMRIFYDAGSIAGVIGMCAVLVVLLWASEQIAEELINGLTSIDGDSLVASAVEIHKRAPVASSPADVGYGRSDRILQPLVGQCRFFVLLKKVANISKIPGINLPLSHLPVILIIVFLCQIIHEAGHAFAAVLDSVRLVSTGLFVTVLFPGAFVHLSSSLDLLHSRAKLRISAAGAWHNLILWVAIGILTWLRIGDALWLSFGAYSDAAGLGQVVISVSQDSPLLEHLLPGSLITYLDDSLMSDAEQWKSHLLKPLENNAPQGWCVSQLWFEDQPVDCCLGNSSTSSTSCFLPSLPHDGGHCLDPVPLFTSPAESSALSERCDDFCKPPSSTTDPPSKICVRPRSDTQLLRITVLPPLWAPLPQRITKTIVWSGPKKEVWDQVRIGRFQPTTTWVPAALPPLWDLFTYYMSTITFSLYFFNLLPIRVLDGGQFLREAMRLLEGSSIRGDDSDEAGVYDIEALEAGIETGTDLGRYEGARSRTRRRRRWTGVMERYLEMGTIALGGWIVLGTAWLELARGGSMPV
ncbi:hypothetical protein BOTBODRAFT_48412 [Botryobasidium botryosum FD-172 SS1]|uniref:Endopeptidase S2P n=1 Tax=Botryobasidium botryosum (strain FD-172 SS1) TaxID=930990 RepID=A0A067LXS5_BOTB1|nr:hypothetical protein BOTBODRAFT_48412 [Botryobasidium botryosum FD-172 SS1]